ncbi:MAG: sigma-70 family RNA polymerase sigma factor [Planctomycetota bacterium]
MEMDDILISKALNGDKVSFGVLTDRYKRQVLGMAFALTRNYDDAEDIAQIVFFKAFSSLKDLNDASKFASWLSKITYATAKDWLRKRKKEAISLEEIQKSGMLKKPVSVSLMSEENLDIIIPALISNLPESIQIALTMRFYDNLSYSEIAEFLDVPQSTVRGMLYRGTQYLKNTIREYMNKHL